MTARDEVADWLWDIRRRLHEASGISSPARLYRFETIAGEPVFDCAHFQGSMLDVAVKSLPKELDRDCRLYLACRVFLASPGRAERDAAKKYLANFARETLLWTWLLEVQHAKKSRRTGPTKSDQDAAIFKRERELLDEGSCSSARIHGYIAREEAAARGWPLTPKGIKTAVERHQRRLAVTADKGRKKRNSPLATLTKKEI